MLRDFLYLNSKLVGQFLAQLEGGVFNEETERRRQTGAGGFSGSLKVPIAKVTAEKGRESTSENERVIRQTPESEFNRLHDYLSEDELIVIEAVDDPGLVAGLKRGIILEIIDASVEISGYQQIAAMAKQLSDLLPFVDLFGGDSSIDKESRAAMKQFASMAESEGPLQIIARIPGKARAVVALELDRRYLVDEVEGESTLLVRVSRILKKGETYLVGDPTGGLATKASRSDRHQLTSGFRTANAKRLGLTNPEIRYPAIIGTAVAIYR